MDDLVHVSMFLLMIKATYCTYKCIIGPLGQNAYETLYDLVQTPSYKVPSNDNAPWMIKAERQYSFKNLELKNLYLGIYAFKL